MLLRKFENDKRSTTTWLESSESDKAKQHLQAKDHEEAEEVAGPRESEEEESGESAHAPITPMHTV
jgi:hypothetical protein